MFGRRQAAILLAEFFGTAVLTAVMLGAHYSAIGVPYFIAIAGGIGLTVAMLAFGGNGGNHFNPAITIGMLAVRQIKLLPAVAYIVAQMLGAWAAYFLVTYLMHPFQSLSTLGGNFDGRVLIAEAAATFVLSVVFAAAVFHGHVGAKVAAMVGAGYAAALIIASMVYPYSAIDVPMNGFANPAVALGMRAFDVVGSKGWLNYVAGPVLGSLLAFCLYALLFAPQSLLGRMRAAVAAGRMDRSSSSAAAAVAPAPAPKAARPSAKRSSRSPRSRKSRK